MGAFLEEQFPKDIDYGSGFSGGFAVDVVTTAGGDEYRSLKHPYVVSSLDVDFGRLRDEVIRRFVDFYMRCGGPYMAFRVHNYADFSTNAYRGTPTAFDQPMSLISPGSYQIMRWYGSPSDPLCRRRIIRKPQANSVLVGVSGAALPTSQWSADYTTGIVTITSKSNAITAITKAASAVITVGTNTFAIGESVVITGVLGMTQINGIRAIITAKPSSTTITVSINSALFSTYTSGGNVQTNPVAGEAVTAGCRFDIPMRFTEDLSGSFTASGIITTSGTNIVEVLNP